MANDEAKQWTITDFTWIDRPIFHTVELKATDSYVISCSRKGVTLQMSSFDNIVVSIQDTKVPVDNVILIGDTDGVEINISASQDVKFQIRLNTAQYESGVEYELQEPEKVVFPTIDPVRPKLSSNPDDGITNFVTYVLMAVVIIFLIGAITFVIILISRCFSEEKQSTPQVVEQPLLSMNNQPAPLYVNAPPTQIPPVTQQVAYTQNPYNTHSQPQYPPQQQAQYPPSNPYQQAAAPPQQPFYSQPPMYPSIPQYPDYGVQGQNYPPTNYRYPQY